MTFLSQFVASCLIICMCVTSLFLVNFIAIFLLFSDTEEVLAWASAQIHCQCTVDDALVKFPSTASQEELATASQDTSFLPCKGRNIYSFSLFIYYNL